MNQAEKKSKTRLVLIILGVVVVLAILGGAGYAIYQTVQPKASPQTNTTKSTVRPPVPPEVLNQGLTKLNETMKQEAINHQKAKDSVNDQSKRIKLTN